MSRSWQITNERPLHASNKATFDVARGPDVTSERIISPPLLRSSHLSGLLPNISRLWCRSRAQVRVPRTEAEQRGTMWMIVLASFLHCVSAYQVDLKKLDGLAKARVEVT